MRFCGRDFCAWCLDIHLVSRPGSLLSVGILRTSFVASDDVSNVYYSLHRCRVYVLSCGGSGVLERTVSVVVEVIA